MLSVKVLLRGSDDPLRAKFLALRRAVYCDRLGYETPETEADNHDECATFVVVVDGAAVVAGCRIVCGRDVTLPMQERLPGISVPQNFAEVSRAIVASRSPCVDLLLYAGIFRHLFRKRYVAGVALFDLAYYRKVNGIFPGFFRKIAEEEWEHAGVRHIPIVGYLKDFRQYAESLIPRIGRADPHPEAV